MIQQITELQQREATDLASISTLKAIVLDRYNIEGTLKAIAEKKAKKKNARKEKRKKLKQTGSSLNGDVSGAEGTETDVLYCQMFEEKWDIYLTTTLKLAQTLKKQTVTHLLI